MKAITVEPKKAGSAQLEEIPEPDVRNGSVLVEAIAVGVCGTDLEIARVNTAGPLPEKCGSCWAMNHSAAWWTRGRPAD
jgi:threonine dehydrogenase-like Zn-dependent dehydrogenase